MCEQLKGYWHKYRKQNLSAIQGISKWSLIIKNKYSYQLHSTYSNYCWAQSLLAYFFTYICSVHWEGLCGCNPYLWLESQVWSMHLFSSVNYCLDYWFFLADKGWLEFQSRYWSLWLVIVDWHLDGVTFVGETVFVLEWDVAICARGFHGELYVCINWIQMVEEGVFLVFDWFG